MQLNFQPKNWKYLAIDKIYLTYLSKLAFKECFAVVDHCTGYFLQQVDSGSKSAEEEAPAASGLLRLELLHCGSNSAGIVDSLVTRFCYFLQQELLVDLLLVDTLDPVHC